MARGNNKSPLLGPRLPVAESVNRKRGEIQAELQRQKELNTPTKIDEHGTQFFEKEAKLHREGGKPAVIYKNGDQEYYLDGLLHREGGPARIRKGRESYYQEGKLHREDGPAVIWPDGTLEWFYNDKIHREDGPAIERPDGSKEWWVNDQKHRIGGPAIITAEGDKEYFKYGKKHRINGPAIDHSSGAQEYYKEGKLHRTNGPAVIWANGNHEYYLDDIQIKKEDFNKLSDEDGEVRAYSTFLLHHKDNPEFKEEYQIMIDLDSTIWPLLEGMKLFEGGEDINYENCHSWGDLQGQIKGGLPRMIELFDESSTYETMMKVGPYEGASHAIRNLAAHGIKIHIMTNRPAQFSDDTERFLKDNNIPYNSFICNKEHNKLALCQEKNISVLIDDHPLLLKDAHKAGLTPLALKFPYNSGVIKDCQIPETSEWEALSQEALNAIEDRVRKLTDKINS